MKKILFLPFIFFACQTRTADHLSTIQTLQKSIDKTLENKRDHIDFYLGVKTTLLNQLIECSKEISQLLDKSPKGENLYLEVKSLVGSKYKDFILFNDWPSNIDSTLTGADLKLNILVNELSFLNRELDVMERGIEYSFKEIGFMTKTEMNVTQVYITTVVDYPFAEFLFPYTMSDSLQQGYRGITDTMRIVGRQSGDHYTIVNKDGTNYKYVLKFPKADGRYEYFSVK